MEGGRNGGRETENMTNTTKKETKRVNDRSCGTSLWISVLSTPQPANSHHKV